MKKYLIILALIISTTICAQNNFYKAIINSSDDKLLTIFEDDGSFILAGGSTTQNRIEAYVLKIDSVGNIINTLVYGDTISDYAILSSIMTDTTYVFIGGKGIEGIYGPSYLWVLITDKNLNIIRNVSYFATNSLNFINYNSSIIDSDSNIVVAGYNYNQYPQNMQGYLYKLSTEGDYIMSNINDFPDTNCYFFDLIESGLHNYKVMASSFYSLGTNQIVEIDDSLKYISYKVVNASIYPGSNGVFSHLDSIYYLLYNSYTMNSSYNFVKVCKYSILNDSVVSEIDIGPQDTINSAAFRGISRCSNGFYVGYTLNASKTNQWYGEGQKSEFALAKLDFAMNVTWQKQFSYQDAYIKMTVVQSTSDNGCIMIGAIQDINATILKNDILIIKVDSNGQTTWTKNIELPDTKIKLFPNPTSDFINLSIVSSTKTIKEITIYNVNGKQVLHQQINSQQTQLNVSSLASGIYIIEGYTQGGEVFREKFVVE